MSSKKQNVSYNDDSENMETIEQHRTEILPGTSAELQPPDKDDCNKEDSTLDNVSEQTVSCCASIGYMKIEVVMFLFMFSSLMRSICSTTMIMDKACLVHLKYSEEICKNLQSHPNIKEEVEKLANNYVLAHSLSHTIPTSVLVMFVGSWSDKYGRKFPLMVALSGLVLEGLGGSLCAAFFYSRIEFFLIPTLLAGFTGGTIGVLNVLYSYASDTTTVSSRTLKYALMEMVFGLSVPLGHLAGGWIYKFFGYTVVYMTSTVGEFISLLWITFFIKETRGLDNKDSWAVKLRNLCSTQKVVEGFKEAMKKRPNKGKEQIISLIVAISIAVMTSTSTTKLNYLYAHHQYDWGNTIFSTVSAIFSVVGTVAMLVSVPILKRLNFGDPSLGLIGSISLLLKNVAVGLANTKELYFFANLAGLLGGLASLACRSRVSKVASKNDIGKVFAFLTAAETLLPIISMAVMSQIFNASLSFYPGLVFIIAGFLLLIPIGVFIWLRSLPSLNYEEIQGNLKAEEIPEKPTQETQNGTVA